MTGVETPVHPRQRWVWLAAALVAVLRLAALDADPSPRMRDPVIMDEGLWAGSARGEVLFEDYFAEDHGEGYLIAPLYTHVLAGVYEVFGLGLWQTRLLAAATGAGALLLLGLWMAARGGTRAGVTTVLLGGVTQLFDQHSRIALLEMPEAFFVTASFVLLFARRRRILRAFAAGVAMAAAVSIKPNAVDFGVVPLALAYLLELGDARRAGAVREWGRRGAATIVGGIIGLAAFAMPTWLSHWPQLLAAARFESGISYYTAAEHLFRLAHPGTWTPIRDAPTVVLGCWCWLLVRPRQPMEPTDRALLAWLVGALVMCEISFMPVPRRYVLVLLPGCAIAARFLMQHGSFSQSSSVTLRWRLSRCLLLVLLPAWLIKRPFQELLVPWLPQFGADWLPVTRMQHEDCRAYLATWIWLLVCIGATALLWSWPRIVDRASRLAGQLGSCAVVGLAIFESCHLGCLPPHTHSMVDATAALERVVPRGSVVGGMFAATLLLPWDVRTVWRVVPGRLYSTPPPNPDAAVRLQPDYVIDGVESFVEMSDVTASGFRKLLPLELLPGPEGPRIRLLLWQRE